jgi:hypothetical protein
MTTPHATIGLRGNCLPYANAICLLSTPHPTANPHTRRLRVAVADMPALLWLCPVTVDAYASLHPCGSR